MWIFLYVVRIFSSDAARHMLLIMQKGPMREGCIVNRGHGCSSIQRVRVVVFERKGLT